MKLGKWIATGLPVFLTTAILAAEHPGLTPVPLANTRTAGVASPNVLSPELIEAPVAQGSVKLENPSTLTSYYGYDNDGTMLPATAGALPTTITKVEATKTEPDKNTYLVLRNQNGADPAYDYGRQFLFQGHELGNGGQGYITRVNLEADGAHRITLMATTDINSHSLPVFDGSVWYPFSKRLLFTAEINAVSGGVWQATTNFPSQVEDISGVFGRGGFEGIQADDHGNLIVVEDVSGATGVTYSHAKRPGSFIYRLVPSNVSDLKLGGKMQVLQVASRAHAGPIVFGAGNTDDNILTQDIKDLHTYGLLFSTKWVTIHDTAVDGFTPFDANGLAKTAGGTPFKRPENGQFRPWSGFSEFLFSETGDTNALTEAGSEWGGFGGVFRLRLSSGETGSLSLFYRGDVAHTGFDNCAFWTKDKIVFVEDAGDTLHGLRNALDSAYLFDLDLNYGNPAHQPIRILAEGRDASATLDTTFAGLPGYQNEGDNEITGWHVSDGDPTIRGLIGTNPPTPFKDGWRVFYTQQHGDNFTWEILPRDRNQDRDDRNDRDDDLDR
jgi:hypothetical protein